MSQPLPPEESGLNRTASLLASIAERYVLSLIYFGFAYTQFGWVRYDVAAIGVHQQEALGYFSADATMLTLDLIMGLVLLLGRRASAVPRTLKEIAVPLAASFYFLLFGYISLLPPSLGWLRINHAPVAWRDALDYASLGIAAAGTIFSLWGLISLGRSFGIFVAVRTVVLRGPYRLVRHPMYCGYIIMSIGLLLAEANLALVILVPVQVALFVWRATLEEARLSEFSAEYRAYQRSTGFFFPKLRQAA